MPSVEVTSFLTPMRRDGELLSIKDLNEQINAMIQAICLIEDEDSRIQSMKRIEVVQRDLHCLRSKLESKMPRNTKRPNILTIDHSRLLIGSAEEGYMPLTQKIWQNVQDITQKIDRLSEGLVFIIQRHRNSRQAEASTTKSNENRYPRPDHPSHYDPNIRDKIQTKIYRSRGPDQEKSSYDSLYSTQNPQPDGNQAQVPPNFAGFFYPSSLSQPLQNSQFVPTPKYLNPQLPNTNHYNLLSASSQSSSSSSQLAASRNPHENFTGYPSISGSLNYFPGGRQSKPEHSRPSYQALNLPYPPGSPYWGTPVVPNIVKSSSDSYSSSNYQSGRSSLREYPQQSQRMGPAKYIHHVPNRSRPE